MSVVHFLRTGVILCENKDGQSHSWHLNDVTCPECLSLLNDPDVLRGPQTTMADHLPGIENIVNQEE